jgi:hypothetical protein
LAPEALVTTRKEDVVLQQAIAIFKHGELKLMWACPFCGARNKRSFSNMPPLVAFAGPIPCFCDGCQKGYAITIRQKLTDVITPEMNQ